MSYKLTAACCSHAGRVRKNNEDNYYFAGEYLQADDLCSDGIRSAVTDTGHRFLAVYDGIGGANYGEIASYTPASLTEKLLGERERCEGTDAEFLSTLCCRLNEAVVAAQKECVTDHMGSTMVGAYFVGDRVLIGNLGDSPCFLLRDGELTKLSTDHAEATVIMAIGRKRKGALTQYLGIDPEECVIEPSVREETLREGDFLLLCSDGLTDMVPQEELISIVCGAESVASAVEQLQNAALEAGGRDNITMILCHVESDEAAAPPEEERAVTKSAAALPETEAQAPAAERKKRTPFAWIVAAVLLSAAVLAAVLLLPH